MWRRLARACGGSSMPYYAVGRGRSPGVFASWPECEAQVKGFSGARYKKFNTEREAREFVRDLGGGAASSSMKTENKPFVSYSSTRSYSSTSRQNEERPRKEATKSKPTDPVVIDDTFSQHVASMEERLCRVKRNIEDICQESDARGRRAIMIEPPEPKRRRVDADSFDVDDQGYVQVYTDGACSANGTKSARAGLGVYFGEEHPLNTSRPVSGRATNNCGEIQAATVACRLAKSKGFDKICINTDSKFLIDSFTKWMHGWKKKGWKTKSGEPVKNEIDFKELEAARNGMQVKFNYVEAHKGILGNERADELAKRGAAEYSK